MNEKAHRCLQDHQSVPRSVVYRSSVHARLHYSNAVLHYPKRAAEP